MGTAATSRTRIGFALLALTLSQPAAAQPSDLPCPERPAADACGGSPGEPPIFTFAPGSTEPIAAGANAADTLRSWNERVRPDIRLVLLTGTATTTEAGYTPGLALARAEAVARILARRG